MPGADRDGPAAAYDRIGDRLRVDLVLGVSHSLAKLTDVFA
jgi:hypothetical protein